MKRQLMTRTTEGGRTMIEDATIDTLFDNIEEIYAWAVKGKSIFSNIVSQKKKVNAATLVEVIRESSDTKEASEKLQTELGLNKAAAEYLLEQCISELPDVLDHEAEHKRTYYCEAVKRLKPLLDLKKQS